MTASFSFSFANAFAFAIAFSISISFSFEFIVNINSDRKNIQGISCHFMALKNLTSANMEITTNPLIRMKKV